MYLNMLDDELEVRGDALEVRGALEAEGALEMRAGAEGQLWDSWVTSKA